MFLKTEIVDPGSLDSRSSSVEHEPDSSKLSFADWSIVIQNFSVTLIPRVLYTMIFIANSHRALIAIIITSISARIEDV